MNESTNYLIKRIVKWSSIVVVAIVLLILFATSFTTVKETEQAVVLTFGKATRVAVAGPLFTIPIVQRYEKVDTTTRGFAIGYEEETEISTDDAGMITSDFNFVNVDFFVSWQISDPIKALYASEDPVRILSNCTQSAARSIIGVNTVDNVLTVGKSEIQSEIKEIVKKELEDLDIGIVVTNITIQDTEPPTAEIMDAFKSVENAKQEKDTAINNANKYKNEKIPEARAQGDKIVQDAEATKTSRINDATGQVARFNEMFSEYSKNPDITKKRLFFETMEAIMPGIEVVIEGHDSTQKVYPIKSFMEGTSNEK